MTLEWRNPRRQQGRVPRGGGPGRVLEGVHGDRPEQRHAQSSSTPFGARRLGGLRVSNGVLEDSFYQATGRPLWSALNIYAPTLVIAGQFDTWSFPEDREGLMRDLVHAPVKHSVLIPNATHFVLFEKPRMEFFEAILKFLKE